MQRVAVVGNSGSGKTTLAAQLAERRGIPHLELDSVFHQPGWTELPLEDFRRRVGEFVAGDRWVVDGNYSAVRDVIWERADTLVWIDLPRSVVMRQIVPRSFGRVARRTELWQGNRESWRALVARDPEKSIIWWAWTQHEKYRRRYDELRRQPQWAHLRFVHLRSRRDVVRFLSEAAPLA